MPKVELVPALWTPEVGSKVDEDELTGEEAAAAAAAREVLVGQFEMEFLAALTN